MKLTAVGLDYAVIAQADWSQHPVMSGIELHLTTLDYEWYYYFDDFREAEAHELGRIVMMWARPGSDDFTVEPPVDRLEQVPLHLARKLAVAWYAGDPQKDERTWVALVPRD